MGDGVGDVIPDRLRLEVAVAELSVDVGHIDHLDAQAVVLVELHQWCQTIDEAAMADHQVVGAARCDVVVRLSGLQHGGRHGVARGYVVGGGFSIAAESGGSPRTVGAHIQAPQAVTLPFALSR